MLAFCAKNTRVLPGVLIFGLIFIVFTQWRNESAQGDSKLVGWTDRLRGYQSSGNKIKSENQPQEHSRFDTELRWDDMPVPPTKIVAHAPGMFLQ
jgi:hypothetical protein